MTFERDVNNFPASWRGIVNKWGEFNANYYDRFQDLPAWYVENSNSALFSAAAWAEGHLALCEVDAEKKFYTGRPGRPATYPGRMDIELTIDDGTYWIEAKRRAFSLSASSDYSFRHSFLSASVKEATENTTQCQEAANALDCCVASLVFFSGHIRPDAPERARGTPPLMRSELIAAETAALRANMQDLGRDLGARVYHAVFSQRDCRIYHNWEGYYWPAAFGLCAVIFD
ncbi:hypothetical protein [Rhodosalinus sp. K401]|uniref:hypothetical protein n=1 Tax=Rhodosalinus sp. K401 TaxID=3239195 RepID=UPI0035248B13